MNIYMKMIFLVLQWHQYEVTCCGYISQSVPSEHISQEVQEEIIILVPTHIKGSELLQTKSTRIVMDPSYP